MIDGHLLTEAFIRAYEFAGKDVKRHRKSRPAGLDWSILGYLRWARRAA
ncbi:hypothetical protein [Arhodomonas sp. AD133]